MGKTVTVRNSGEPPGACHPFQPTTHPLLSVPPGAPPQKGRGVPNGPTTTILVDMANDRKTHTRLWLTQGDVAIFQKNRCSPPTGL